jgi:hypothetical protein
VIRLEDFKTALKRIEVKPLNWRAFGIKRIARDTFNREWVVKPFLYDWEIVLNGERNCICPSRISAQRLAEFLAQKEPH